MPAEKINRKAFKEIKVYTLKRLLKKKNKYLGTPNEAEEYRKLEGIFLAKNINPLKLLDRGVVLGVDVRTALNELEEQGLLKIDNNLLTLTPRGEEIAKEIQQLGSLSEIDDSLFNKLGTIKEETISKPVETVEKELSPKPEVAIPSENETSSELIEDIEEELIPEPSKSKEVEMPTTKLYYKCPDCGMEIRSPKNFCPRCGHEIDLESEIKCPVCGNLNTRDSAFCTKCGKRLG